ncbi:ABC transporter permease [Microbacterium sp. No. 7]|uniref:ABC transporter permease n=1 Tax=Microbacterium sp. No. 7 TaxID=1714373 RepID=UPI0006D243BE|nr:ABC transporter permease [Microbacterium sp. No. 7]ALJ19923.1 hypothetical protein AOA12_08390 [Microbacterium sp. No. 7]
MYWIYLRRELAGRARQTAIVAAGLTIAIALVVVVNALSAGVRDAQAAALQSVYGVGTDLTITGAQAEPGQRGGAAGPQFEFGEGGGEQREDGTTALSQSRLTTGFGRGTLDAAAVDAAAAIDGVAAATGALSLTNMTFSGELPQMPSGEETTPDAAPQQGQLPQQGGGGFGGDSFGIDSFDVLGVEPGEAAVGPLTATSLQEGRALADTDAGSRVAVLDATYANSASLAVGDTIDLGGEPFDVVGVVSSASDEADTAADVYVPLDVAQELSGVGAVVSTVYVQADSANAIDGVQSALQDALPDATVSSQSQLAGTVSGSLASASSLISSLGTWLSVVVLGVAVALAVLFTLSGVSRRTRELGTLKAIGWSNGRVVGQVAGESVVQALLGGVAGVLLGLGAVWAVNLVSPTVSVAAGSAAGPEGAAGGMGGMGGADRPGFGAGSAQAASDIVLSAPLSPGIILTAVALAVAAGLVAGALGGWRAARLRPAEALRAVA